MIDECNKNITGITLTPETEDLFYDGKFQALPKDKASEFHTIFSKGLFTCKRSRPDIHPTIAAFCTRVKNHTIDFFKDDTNGQVYQMSPIRISCSDQQTIYMLFSGMWTHIFLKSNRRGATTLGGGAIQYISRNKKLKTWSSNEDELVGADGAYTTILWARLFREYQVCNIYKNILYQGNKSNVLPEKFVIIVQARELVLWTFVIYFWYIILIGENFILSIAPLCKWSVTSFQNPYKGNRSKSSVSLSWDTNMFRPKSMWWHERVGRPKY